MRVLRMVGLPALAALPVYAAPASAQQSRPGFNAGVGVRFKPKTGSGFGIGVEVRGHVILKKNEQIPPEDMATSLLTAMAGINFD